MRRRSRPVLAVLLLLGGCSSGQTGSPDCVSAMSCVCEPLYGGGALLRVQVERSESGKLEAVVQQVLSSPDRAGDLAPGDRVGGVVLAETPCAPGESPAALTGMEVLVVYNAGTTGGYPNCAPFQACAAADCASLSEPAALTDCWNACAAQTESSCARQRAAALLDGVFRWAIPWTEPLSFGDGNELASAELHVLSTPESCLERFPAPALPPCRDTISGACSTVPSTHGGEGSASWLLLLGLLALKRSRRSGR